MDTRTRVRDIVALTLDVPVEAVTDELSADTNDEWDSVRHLTLILAIEDAFGIQFDEIEIPVLTSLSALLRAVEERV